MLILTALICIGYCMLPVVSVYAEEENVETIYYAAFGDSIPNGYCADQEPEIVSYPALIQQDLKEISGQEVCLDSFCKNGLTTKKLNLTILQEPQVQERIEQADLITLTIGANDLLNEFKTVSKEILNNETRFYTADQAMSALQSGIEENPLLLVSVASAIGSWDYDSFEEQWLLAVQNINAHRKEDAQMIVTTIYNPMAEKELPGTLNAVVENVISKMNEIMWRHAEEYDYQVVELLGSGIEEQTQSDGLHPNQTGQDMIRELIEYELDLDAFQSEEADEEAQRELRAAAEKKAREAEQKRRQEQMRKRLYWGGGLCVLIIFVVGIFLIVKKKRKEKKLF